MHFITIPLEYNCYFYLKRSELHYRKSDRYGLMIGAILRDYSRFSNIRTAKRSQKKYYEAIKPPEQYNPKKYETEIRIYFNSNFADRINKITEEAVIIINNTIRSWIREEYIIYIDRKTKEFPQRMYKEHIYHFCEEYGLMVNDTFFETLKKFEYRRRKKNEEK